jgi:hypothetical protein
MKKLSIAINDIELKANLLDTPTADAIYNILPIEGKANIWGDEIYFEIPIHLGEEAEAKEEVEVGDLAFWPIGSAFCIFFGRTPVSTGNKPRAFSPVNIFGRIEGNLDVLKGIGLGNIIRIKKC